MFICSSNAELWRTDWSPEFSRFSEAAEWSVYWGLFTWGLFNQGLLTWGLLTWAECSPGVCSPGVCSPGVFSPEQRLHCSGEIFWPPPVFLIYVAVKMSYQLISDISNVAWVSQLVWWWPPVISAQRWLRQEGREFKANLNKVTQPKNT